jgi:hypothetical protein
MQNRKLPNLISILVLTLITVVMWITLNIYRAIATTTTPSVPDEVSLPLTPDLDKDTVNSIGSKIFLDESQIPNTTFSSVQIPLPSTAPTTVASPEATIAPNQSTQSGSPTP